MTRVFSMSRARTMRIRGGVIERRFGKDGRGGGFDVLPIPDESLRS